MPTLSSVPVLFALFYFLPGAVFVSYSFSEKEKRFENAALAVLLSLVLAPLTFTLLGRVFPGNGSLLLAGYVFFWGLAFVGVRLFGRGIQRRLPDFGGLPKADRGAWLLSVLLAAIVVSLRFSIFQGFGSPIGDDLFHLTKLTSIAATGLPSLYARQPLYPFIYYDLDYIAPALWVRYTEGAVGVAQAWVVHIGIQTFAASLFFTRLCYVYANTRMTRLFGLLALHTTTGLDIFFLPLIKGQSLLDAWPLDLKWFDGFVGIIMPINNYVWVPQHVLGVAVVGLIGYLTIVRPLKGFIQAVFVALLLVALFKTSTFVFVGAVPGFALWHLHELLKGKERIRQLSYLATTALIALALVFPSLIELLNKQSYLQFGLRSFVFFNIPWLKYPLTVFVYLLLEIGILLPLLLWVQIRPHLTPRPILFWLCLAVGFLFPFIVRSPLYNDIATRAVMPAQLAAAIIGCSVLIQWEHRKRRFVAALVMIQVVLSVVSVGVALHYRFTSKDAATIPLSSRWIAHNTPLNALVFYEQDFAEHDKWVVHLTEVTHGQRLSYIREPVEWDYNYTPTPSGAWRCLPDINLYDANSLCSIEAYIPGVQPVFIKYLSSEPVLDAASFVPVHKTENGSIFSLSCPFHDPPDLPNPPVWLTDCSDSSWTFTEHSEPLTVHYDDGITLQEIIVYHEGGGGIVMHWQTAPQNDISFGISLRFYNADDEKIYQQDAVLWNQYTGHTNNRNHPEQFSTLVLFDYLNAAPLPLYNQTILLDFPEDFPPGDYELRLTVYDVQTMQETVELGTWKPEVGLARLRLAPDSEN